MYVYKNSVVTIEIEPLVESDWIWATGSLTANPAVGSLKNVGITMAAGFRASNIVADSATSATTATSATSATYSNYGTLGTTTISNTTDKTGQWAYFGYFTISYNASYLRGHCANIRVRLQEINHDGTKNLADLDDFVLILKASMPYHANSTEFNTKVPSIHIEIEGKTSISPNDVAGLVYSTSTSTKTIRFYIRLKEANTVYQINPEQRYGRSFATSSYSATTSYFYFTYASTQTPVTSLPTPAQGSIVYAVKRTIDADTLNGNFAEDFALRNHTHTIANITNLQSTLNAKAPLASPNFTGVPTAPTAPNGTNTDQIATTKFVQNALSAGGYGDMLRSQYDTDSDGIVDRAETADKLTTARTISLSGDVTGSASFDGSGNISINATVVDDSHTHDGRYYTKSEILNNDISMRRLLVNANGVPTSNLGNPTVAEMALFEEQFNNKLAFYDISKFTFEVFDGTTWTDVTSSISTTNKKRLVGGDNTASIVIPNGATKYRITIRNNGSYVYINALYMYWSSAGNSSQIHIWKKRDDGDWVQHTNSSTSVSAWPGHLYLPFASIPWSTASTSGHYNDVRIEFTPTWKNANNITLNKLQLWGGYPASKRRIYSIDENKNVTFPASVTATTFNGDLSGRVNGIKITVGTTAPSNPQVNDIWIDLS